MLLLGLLAFAVLSVPLAANGASPSAPALVPAGLLADAQANPDNVFSVIVQGRGGEQTADVVGDVSAERSTNPGKGRGVRKRFATIAGVSAELTGQQIVNLAARGSILTITRDAPIALGGGIGPVAPSMTAPPQITGLAKKGETLTATQGTWTGSDPITYLLRWQRCDALGSVCVDIVGAAGDAYVADAADVGSTLRVAVTATNAIGSETAVSDPTAVVAAAPVGPLPPVNLAPPTLSGTAVGGQTLSASAGTWGGSFPIAYTYAWERCDATGFGCAAAVGAAGASYSLTEADVGRTVRVVVTATDAGGSTTAASLPTAVVTAIPRVPAVSAPPAVSGDARDGATLTAAPGIWTPSTQTYVWERCGPAYAGAVLADQPTGYWRFDGSLANANGHGLDGVSTGPTRDDANGATANSHALSLGNGAGVEVPGVATAVLAGAFTLETWVRVDRPQQDRGLLGRWRYADGGALLWIDTNGRYAFAAGTDATAYLASEVSPAVGRWQHVVGTFDGTTLRLYVDGVEVAAKAFTGNVGNPVRNFEIGKYGDPTRYLEGSVDETALYTRALTVAEVRTHDLAGCHAIAGATGASYTATSSDIGKRLRVQVVATNEVGSASAVSGATGAIAASPPTVVTPPTLSGATIETQTLTSTSGTWNGTGPFAHSYRWQRCDATGAGCVDVPGETGATHTLSADDVGHALRVVVSTTSPGGTGEAASAPTAPIVTAAPASLSPPTVSGIAEEGGTLNASTGAWSGLEPTHTVSWERCNAAGASCAPIAGANTTTYVAVEADVGSTVRAVVTATNAAGSASRASAPSPVVADAYNALQQWPSVVNAQNAWASAKAHVAVPTIAIVDSGIDANRADFGGRVVYETTLTTLTPNSPGDGRGHGTFVASVAAGEAPGYAGVAPDAKLVSIDVLDDSGRATTSDVIAAVDWIYQNKAAYGIRVANLSLHGTTRGSFRYDPLNKAVQKLWFSGVVVVTSSGNYATNGAASGVLFPPGNDPFVITVGATETMNTVATDDDVTAPWSAWGKTPDGFQKPELSAPGRYIVGAVPPNSTLAQERPGNLVAPGYMQLSGTSFAAPVVSGAAAYILGAHPDWTPDLVKGALMRASIKLPAATRDSYGIGELRLADAAAMTTPPNPNTVLNRYLIPDPAGGPEPIFDVDAWTATAQSNEFWGDEFWGDHLLWGSEFWGDEFWGDSYWDPPVWSETPPAGDSADAIAALNNASNDLLPAGGYWLTRP